MAKKRRKAKEIISTKEFLYRGKTLEELKALDVRESAKFLPSQSRRSVLKNFNMIENFIKNCESRVSKKKKIRTHLRDIVIVPKLVGFTIGIHSGKTFQDIAIEPEMIGHRLGEFVPTRGLVKHGSAGIGATKSSRALKK
ncbi:30S ribosomal protein S19 [Candidatus Pacearchaeota archaeon]|nr:30S ribosomal protein S19 [Candidatus Pacearchaeota archaeon]|tara:strand:- start:13790 stop:14209 length:420 start_codon:yes stop_codon:yes gene_type:complete